MIMLSKFRDMARARSLEEDQNAEILFKVMLASRPGGLVIDIGQTVVFHCPDYHANLWKYQQSGVVLKAKRLLSKRVHMAGHEFIEGVDYKSRCVVFVRIV